MNNILNIKTPAESEAGALKSDYGLDNHGLTNLRKTYWNLPTETANAIRVGPDGGAFRSDRGSAGGVAGGDHRTAARPGPKLAHRV